MLWRLIVALVLLEGVARAEDPLAIARTAVARSEYSAARLALGAALEGGGRSPAETAEIYELAGRVAGALGDTAAATQAFTQLLALDPKATLPPGTSPKITQPFAAAGRYFLDHAPLELKIETRSSPPTLTVVAISDPLAMIEKVRVLFTVDGSPEQTREAAAAPRIPIALPAGRRIDARVVALDHYGNRLVEIGNGELTIVIIGEPPPVVKPQPPRIDRPAVASGPRRPLYLRWWPYAAAAGAFAGATVYFGLAARSDGDQLNQLNAQSSLHNFSETQAVEDRARRDVLLTNIGIGVVSALAVTSGAMFVLARRGSVEVRATPVATRGGGALVLGGAF